MYYLRSTWLDFLFEIICVRFDILHSKSVDILKTLIINLIVLKFTIQFLMTTAVHKHQLSSNIAN